MKKIYIAIGVLLTVSCSNVQQSQKIQVQNAQNDTLFVTVDGMENAKTGKLAILQHGLASNKEHAAVQAAKKAFLDNHYVVVSFDSRYSLGEGNNDVTRVRLTTFEEDLATVASWAKTQPFYHEPFALAGHSLGGASVLQFGAEYPAQVSVLVPITPVVSGKKWEVTCMKNMTDFCKNWKQNGSYDYTDPLNSKTAHIPYAVVTDAFGYNAYKIAPQIQAKTLLIAAQNDNVVEPQDVQKLGQNLKNGQNIVVTNSGHNFLTTQNQADLYWQINTFLKQ